MKYLIYNSKIELKMNNRLNIINYLKFFQSSYKSTSTLSNVSKSFDSIPGPKSYPFVKNLFSLKRYGNSMINIQSKTNILKSHF